MKTDECAANVIGHAWKAHGREVLEINQEESWVGSVNSESIFRALFHPYDVRGPRANLRLGVSNHCATEGHFFEWAVSFKDYKNHVPANRVVSPVQGPQRSIIALDGFSLTLRLIGCVARIGVTGPRPAGWLSDTSSPADRLLRHTDD